MVASGKVDWCFKNGGDETTSDLESPGSLVAYGMFLGKNSVGTDDRVSQDSGQAVIAVGTDATVTRHPAYIHKREKKTFQTPQGL